jgi:phospholipid/cholesterol/gamma-HCH transport system ATP-binding protein
MSISVEKVRKAFGEKEVLKGIDFVFEDAKVNMIIGSSGSGKTVLIKCIVGLMRPDAGQISFEGQELLLMTESQLRQLRHQIGMLFQSSALFDSMTVAQNVAFPIEMFSKMTRKQINDRVEFCLNAVNLPNTGHLLPASLSGGMKKRAGLARAIAMNPKYLICDEPNSGLDPETGQLIDHLIADLTYQFNTTTIVITHDIKSVLSIGDKVMFLYQGIKDWEGDKHAIIQSDNPRLNQFIKTSGLM